MSIELRLAGLGWQLPPAPQPMGAYRPLVLRDGLAYLSGHGPLQADGSLITGRLGESADVAAGYAAARQTGLAMLATLRAGLGSLDRVTEVVKLLGMVSCTPDFYQQPAVINGCSELFRELWGDPAGVAARSAVGVTALPANMLVEIEGIFAYDAETVR